MRSPLLAATVAVLLGACLALLLGCDRGAAESTTDDSADGATRQSSNTNGDDADQDAAGENPSASIEAFGERMTTALTEGDMDTILARVEGVGLPEGWQSQVTPLFATMRGEDLEGQVRPVDAFSREDLQWPEGDLPEALAAVEHILEVTFENADESGDRESGRFTFPLKRIDGEWRLLLVGPGA